MSAAAPARRDRAGTEQRLIDAAARVIARDGFNGFSLAAVAAEAGCDRKLIQRYFGGADGLLEAIAGDVGLWIGAEDDTPPPAGSYAERLAAILALYRARLHASPLLQRVLAWELVEPSPALDQIEARRSRAMGAWMERMRGQAVPPPGVDAPAINAILLAAAHYLELRAHTAGRFAGIDLADPAAAARIEAAFTHLLTAALKDPAR